MLAAGALDGARDRQRGQPVIAGGGGLALPANRGEEAVPLDLQRLAPGDPVADHVAFGRAAGLAQAVPLDLDLDVRVERQVLREVVDDEHPVLAGDRQLADLRRRQPVDLEHARRAGPEAQRRADEILRSLLRALLGLRVDALDLAARQEPDNVDVVGGEVERDAGRRPPAGIRRQAPSVDLVDPSGLAGLEALAKRQHRGVAALDQPDGEREAAALGLRDERLRILLGGRQRLLHEDREARAKPLARHGREVRGRDGDAGEVRVDRVRRLGQRREHRHAKRRAAIAVLAGGVRDRDEPHVGTRAQHPQMQRAHDAEAGDDPAKRRRHASRSRKIDGGSWTRIGRRKA